MQSLVVRVCLLVCVLALGLLGASGVNAARLHHLAARAPIANCLIAPLLNHPLQRHFFDVFARDQHEERNIDAFRDGQRMLAEATPVTPPTVLAEHLAEIWQAYVDPSLPNNLNLPGTTVELIKIAMNKGATVTHPEYLEAMRKFQSFADEHLIQTCELFRQSDLYQLYLHGAPVPQFKPLGSGLNAQLWREQLATWQGKNKVGKLVTRVMNLGNAKKNEKTRGVPLPTPTPPTAQ